MRKTIGNILKYMLSLAIAAVFVWLVIRKIEWDSFVESLKTTDWVWMIGYMAAAVLALVFRAQRWKQLLKPLEPSIRYGRCWDASNIGNLGSLVVPGSCEPIRAGIITSKRVPFQTVFGTMIMERAWDFLFIFLTFIITLLIKWKTFSDFVENNILEPIGHSAIFWWAIVIIVLLGVSFIWCTYRFKNKSKFFGQIADIIDGLLQGLGSFGKMKNKFPYIFQTVMIWAMYMLMSYFCLKAIPELSGLDMTDALFLSALGNIVSIIPAPGGMGTYHYLIMISLVSLYGVGQETGLLFAVLNHEGHAILVLVLGIWSYIMRILVMKNKDAREIREERHAAKSEN